MTATIVFCSDPLEPRKPDEAFAREAQAALDLAMSRLLIDHDALDQRHDGAAAVKRVRTEAPLDAVYRGWMLRADDYHILYDALGAKNVTLINTPQQYAACHHAPESYAYVAPWAAQTRWITSDNLDDPEAITRTLADFGARSVVLKDWVKSQAAGYWDEACFIADASDHAQVQRVIARFRELQGDSLVGGLVFRAYAELNRIAGQTEEWRAFVLDNKALGCWPRQDGSADAPPPSIVAEAAAALPSRFATIDFARRADGGWLLLETGDGQVSEIPSSCEPSAILRPLQAALR
jgi:hypothetical protein